MAWPIEGSNWLCRVGDTGASLPGEAQLNLALTGPGAGTLQGWFLYNFKETFHGLKKDVFRCGSRWHCGCLDLGLVDAKS